MAELTALEQTPRPLRCRKLQATDQWRIRVGDYRILYRVDDPAREVTVMRVAHRRDVYRP